MKTNEGDICVPLGRPVDMVVSTAQPTRGGSSVSPVFSELMR